jgi:isoleucyl-tRNA synthetase
MEAEEIWRGLTGGESVHLADWPYTTDAKTGAETELGQVLRDDPALVSAMEQVREIVSGTLSLRKAEQIRVRQPLSKLTVIVEDVEAIEPYTALLESELNVKDVAFSTIENASEQGLDIVHELRVNARAAGPRLGKQVQFAIKASKTGAWHVDDAGTVLVETPSGEIALESSEYELNNSVKERDAELAANSVSASLTSGGFVILDTELNDDLLAEGYARDAIRVVQDARKDAGLDIADRITLKLDVPAADVSKIEQFKELIAGETLATEVAVESDDAAQELSVVVAKA